MKLAGEFGLGVLEMSNGSLSKLEGDRRYRIENNINKN
jgi:hypothetical protein